MVPITLSCLGEYKNGVWLTISSILLWIDNMDIGLGNGMRNKLAAYLAHDEKLKARILVSSSFAMLTFIVIPIMLVFVGLIVVSNNYHLLNIDSALISNLDQILIISVILAFTTFIFKLTGNFYMGLQLPAISNLLIATGQTLAIAGTYVLYLSGSHSLLHIALVNLVSPLFVYAVAYHYTFYFKYPHLRPSMSLVSIKESKNVISIGLQFFMIQIASVILFMTSNILISKLFSPALVTPYQITYRYFSIMLVVFTVICMPFWNATTDAYARNDIQWIRRTERKLNMLMVYGFLALVIMVLLSNYVYSIWVGNKVNIPIHLSASIALYFFILIVSLRYSVILNGLNILRIQLSFIVPATIVFLPLAWFVCNTWGTVTSLVLTMCLVNTPGLIANAWKYYQLIHMKNNIEKA
jgi:O-antigen/teichoic acid export membrane protein